MDRWKEGEEVEEDVGEEKEVGKENGDEMLGMNFLSSLLEKKGRIMA